MGNGGSFKSSAAMSTTRPRHDRRRANRPRTPRLLYLDEESIGIAGWPNGGITGRRTEAWLPVLSLQCLLSSNFTPLLAAGSLVHEDHATKITTRISRD